MVSLPTPDQTPVTISNPALLDLNLTTGQCSPAVLFLSSPVGGAVVKLLMRLLVLCGWMIVFKLPSLRHRIVFLCRDLDL